MIGAAWLASQLSSSFPLLQVGGLYQAGGTQNSGLMASFSGIDVVLDANGATTNGAGTNEDVIIILAREDFILMESPIFARVNPDVGSGNAAIEGAACRGPFDGSHVQTAMD